MGLSEGWRGVKILPDYYPLVTLRCVRSKLSLAPGGGFPLLAGPRCTLLDDFWRDVPLDIYHICLFCGVIHSLPTARSADCSTADRFARTFPVLSSREDMFNLHTEAFNT